MINQYKKLMIGMLLMIFCSAQVYALEHRAACVYHYWFAHSNCSTALAEVNVDERKMFFKDCRKKAKRKLLFCLKQDQAVKSKVNNSVLLKPVIINKMLARCHKDHIEAARQCQKKINMLESQKKKQNLYFQCISPHTRKMQRCRYKYVKSRFDVPPLMQEIIEPKEITEHTIELYNKQVQLANLLNINSGVLHELAINISRTKKKSRFNDLSQLSQRIKNPDDMLSDFYLHAGEIYFVINPQNIGGKLILKLVPRLTPRGQPFYECLVPTNEVDPLVLPGICRNPSNAASLI